MERFRAVVVANAPVVSGSPRFIRRHTAELVSVANKPILFHALEALRDADIHEVALVVNPNGGDEIREAVRDGSDWGMQVTYIPRRPQGRVDAVSAARSVLGDAPFVVYPGNTILLDKLEPLLRRFSEERLQALMLAAAGDPPVRTDGLSNGQVTDALRAITSAGSPQSEPCGVYVFGPLFHEAAAVPAPSWRGMVELADVVAALLERGEHAQACSAEECVSYTGQPQELLEGNRVVLDRMPDNREDAEISDSKVQGRVSISSSARIESTTIRGPAVIGPGAWLADAYIGPYTTIGASAVIRGAEVEDSVIMAGVEVRDLEARISGSVLGEAVTVNRDFSLPRVLELTVAHGSTAMLG